jgi:uncharacterized membrane protein YhaH (DUF805 family)
MSKHTFWIIIGCGIPLLLIFFAPVLGISGDVSLFIFILAMFLVHLLMPMHNHNDEKGTKPNSINSQHHQH